MVDGCCKVLFFYVFFLFYVYFDFFFFVNDFVFMKKFGKVFFVLFVLLLLVVVLFLYWLLIQCLVFVVSNDKFVDVVLVGVGIMSIILVIYLQELQLDWNIQVYECFDGVVGESFDGWNNVGIGYLVFVELNYILELFDGSIEIKCVVGIVELFEVLCQFWLYQVKEGCFSWFSDFINLMLYMSFVWGDDNIVYLYKCQQVLVKNLLFYGMQYFEDLVQIKQWVLLLMEGCDLKQKVVVIWMLFGIDVNFGVIICQLIVGLQCNLNFSLYLNYEVIVLWQNVDKSWNVMVKDFKVGIEIIIYICFVFIGVGGVVLKLLQMLGILELKDYVGFLVGGQFFVFQGQDVILCYGVKVYGMVEIGLLLMLVLYLDVCKLDGKLVVLFGLFVLYSIKFFKYGLWWDLYFLVIYNNVGLMLEVGKDNLDLVQYLMGQVCLNDVDCQVELVKYFFNVKLGDWKLVIVGQCVQIIKCDLLKGLVLQFGIEIVIDKDYIFVVLFGVLLGVLILLLIMLDLMVKVFLEQMKVGWEICLCEIVLLYGCKFNDSLVLVNEICMLISQILQLLYLEVLVDVNVVLFVVVMVLVQIKEKCNVNEELQVL